MLVVENFSESRAHAQVFGKKTGVDVARFGKSVRKTQKTHNINQP